MSTIKEVAALAKVSVSTAYKVFDSNYTTRPDIKKKVMEAAKILEYAPKGPSIRRTDSSVKLIGLVITEATASNGFYSNVIRAFANEMERYGHQLAIFHTNEDYEKEKLDIEILMSHGFDGIIFNPSSWDEQQEINVLIQKGFPTLQLFKPVYQNVDTLLIDDEMGTYLAVRHLLQNRHQKIMMIGKTHKYTNNDRLSGYKRAYKEAGIDPDSDLMCLMIYEESIKEMIKALIEKHRPTAILSISESITVGVIQSVREMGLSIPEDISLISYDDFPWLTAYGITAVGHSFENIGALGCKMMNNQIFPRTGMGHSEPSTLVLDPILISRNSVKMIP